VSIAPGIRKLGHYQSGTAGEIRTRRTEMVGAKKCGQRDPLPEARNQLGQADIDFNVN
jgi:hypothetical protein